MAEDEAIFDPSLKKKRKKKKTGFNLDSVVNDTSSQKEASPTHENGETIEQIDDTTNVDDIESGKKKIKKKKKAFNLDDIKDSLEDTADNINADNATIATMESLDFDTMDFDIRTKKKPSKKTKTKTGLDLLTAAEIKGEQDKENGTVSGDTWTDTDRDYTYDELLQRAFNQLREKNPDMATGEKKKFVMKPPQVVRIGSKKSAFVNFSDICRLLHRIPKHLLNFLLAELGTSGSIDGSNQLIIKGRFQQKQIENVLRRYIKEYVTCHTCRSPDTILQKDARLYFLQCEQCNSRCSVAPIKSGFQAVANKQQRQAIRANKN